MKAEFEGMRPGEPAIKDDEGRLLGLILRLVPETPEEVAELKKFCRLTDAFTFVIDEDYRMNQAHIAPVYGERTFSVVSRSAFNENG
ncbi:MAG TPA: hypothetical protein VFB21_04215 [Chthonomonadaceae bacterium]|nr:hypothetical protein [Chthonomonadaceae bacterium]